MAKMIHAARVPVIHDHTRIAPPNDGRGRPDLHNRADHSDEDDDANDNGSKDAHEAIIRAGLTTIKKAATNFDKLCYFG